MSDVPRLCRHLLTKTMFIPALYSQAVGPAQSGTAVWWCQETHGPCGPDGGPVDREDCTEDRSCWEPGPRLHLDV